MKQPFSAALIAGGKSSRFGGDKKFLKVEGIALWERQVKMLATLNPAELLISGPADGPWAGRFRSLEDAAGSEGPLGGVAAVLEAAACESLLVLAVDMPLMTEAWLEQLLSARTPGIGLLPCFGGRFEPLAAIYPRSCAEIAHACIRNGEASMQNFCRRLLEAGLADTFEISAADLPLFANLNTPADLAAFAAHR
jgi:molybdopterin-guanine dinucleotide biosynthesis protein A